MSAEDGDPDDGIFDEEDFDDGNFDEEDFDEEDFDEALAPTSHPGDDRSRSAPVRPASGR